MNLSLKLCRGTVLITFLLVSWTQLCQAQNLIDDPSFELTQPRNRFGLVFPKWQGWIFADPASFVASPIAHSGNTSCEMIGDAGGKIRMFTPLIKAAAGRYQVKGFIRGLDVGKGDDSNPMDFSCGFDGKFFKIHRSGTFGWTPVNYVFDYPGSSGDGTIRIYFGLLGGGRMWLDDVSLEKVDSALALTPEPVVGAEEAPIAPPKPVGADAVRCPDCQYLNPKGAIRCFACGTELLKEIDPARSGPPVKVIADFSDGTIAPLVNGTYTSEHVPTGEFGVRFDNNIQIITPQNWAGYDFFKFDAFNPGDKTISLTLEVRDAQTTDYWTRVNLTSVIPPGKSTVTFSTNMYVGEKSKPGRMLLKDQITRVVLSLDSGSVVASNFRLERAKAPPTFPSLYAFSAGPYDAPLMKGFHRLPIEMDYAPGRGYGWENATFWRSMNVLQPDSLTQSCITPTGGDFRLDLPNGKYHVVMNLDFPGGYWGEPQVYTSRQVTANDKLVVDDKMDMAGFVHKLFRNAHHEDLPGIDTFDAYVQKMFEPKVFDVDVTDGVLKLGFKGEALANCLSYLIIYPTNKDEQGKAFEKWTTDQRREEFNDYFKQVEPKRGPALANGYKMFTRPMGVPINAFDAPAANEMIGTRGLFLTVAQQEISPITFAIQPSSHNLGPIDLAISKFMNEGGSVLDPATFQPGWLDYRITRVEPDGTVYTVSPRYWHPTPAPSAPKVTRRFWVRVQTPANTPPGLYRGSITVKPRDGEPRTIPVALTVLPFALDPIGDVAVGPFGSTMDIAWPNSDPAAHQWNWDMFSKSLDVLRDAGCTAFTGVPRISAKAANGKITLDTDEADQQMKLIRAKGFTKTVGSYGAGPSLGYAIYGTPAGPDTAAATQAGFPDMRSFLAALYGAIDQHAQEHQWLPIAWNLCDEPIGDAISASTANVLAHREILPGLKLTTFTGATSMTGADPTDPHLALIKALPMPMLSEHDEASIEALRAAGNTLALYNGASRWTYGRYLKMMVLKYGLAMRVSWYFNATAGDPYYALDCREDDYCWFNTDEHQTMVPSVDFLTRIIPGLNDYRYLSTLQRLLKEHPGHAHAQKVFDDMMAILPGVNRTPDDHGDPLAEAALLQKDREAITTAIGELLK